jgi:hypothetical protein
MASLPKPVESAPLRWRPLAAHDLPVVAALEARIHAAPWSERNFRDALARERAFDEHDLAVRMSDAAAFLVE